MRNTPNVAALSKPDFSSSISNQGLMAPWLGVGLHFLSSVLGFCLAWDCTDLLCATSASVHMSMLCMEKIPWIHSHLALIFFPFPVMWKDPRAIPQWPPSLRGDYAIHIFHLCLGNLRPLNLCTLANCWALCWSSSTIYGSFSDKSWERNGYNVKSLKVN